MQESWSFEVYEIGTLSITTLQGLARVLKLCIHKGPCPAQPDLSFFENTVDPDQLGSDEAI